MYTRWVIMSRFVLVVKVFCRVEALYPNLILFCKHFCFWSTSAPDGMVLATSAHHNVPAGIVVHDWRTRLQYDDFLQQGGATWTYHPYRQNGYRRRMISCSHVLHQRRFSFNFGRFSKVFGAYCSSRWAERKSKDSYGGRQGYFGTGETFVFTLVPNEIKYPWVGISPSTSSEGPSCVRHAAELFMASDGHMITIGGG